MGNKVEQRHDGCRIFPEECKRKREHAGCYAEEQVQLLSELFAEHNDYRAFAALSVGVAVAIVIKHEECVGYHAARNGADYYGNVYFGGLQIVGSRYGNYSEECKNQQVAETYVGKQCGVEKSKQHACSAQKHEPHSGFAHQQTAA